MTLNGWLQRTDGREATPLHRVQVDSLRGADLRLRVGRAGRSRVLMAKRDPRNLYGRGVTIQDDLGDDLADEVRMEADAGSLPDVRVDLPGKHSFTLMGAVPTRKQPGRRSLCNSGR